MFQRFSLITLTIFFIYLPVLSQNNEDYTWWNETHNWDGKTHWSNMIKRLPGLMGPNALPIPKVRNSNIDRNLIFSKTYNYHFSKNEIALNPQFNLEIPIAPNKVAIDLNYVPFEYYKTNEYIRNQRFARKKSAKGATTGDLYIGTIIQLLNKDKHLINAILRLTLKTTTGKDLANARHIDAPAYHFDINFGREFNLKNSFLTKISTNCMLGLYVWQMNSEKNRQNDAFLFGIRNDFYFKNFVYTNSFLSYTGYLKQYDRPIAINNSVKIPFKNIDFYFSHSYGLRDHIKHTFSSGIIWRIKILN